MIPCVELISPIAGSAYPLLGSKVTYVPMMSLDYLHYTKMVPGGPEGSFVDNDDMLQLIRN